MYNLEELEKLTLQWSQDRGILTNGNPSTQCLKLISEAGELMLNIFKDKDIKDDIGDCLVVICNISGLTNSVKIINCVSLYESRPLLTLLGNLSDNVIKNNNLDEDIISLVQGLRQIAHASGLTLAECWNVAYEDIKDRKGFLNEHGNFVKSTTPGYEKMYAEFLEKNK